MNFKPDDVIHKARSVSTGTRSRTGRALTLETTLAAGIHASVPSRAFVHAVGRSRLRLHSIPRCIALAFESGYSRESSSKTSEGAKSVCASNASAYCLFTLCRPVSDRGRDRDRDRRDRVAVKRTTPTVVGTLHHYIIAYLQYRFLISALGCITLRIRLATYPIGGGNTPWLARVSPGPTVFSARGGTVGRRVSPATAIEI